jgi:hypothetical protein
VRRIHGFFSGEAINEPLTREGDRRGFGHLENRFSGPEQHGRGQCCAFTDSRLLHFLHFFVGLNVKQRALLEPVPVGSRLHAIYADHAGMTMLTVLSILLLTDGSQAATWPDFIKCEAPASYCPGAITAIDAFNPWHFADKVYNPDNLTVPEEAATAWKEQPSATWLLGEAALTFSESKTTWGWSFMLRMFLHILGDIHQPLHCAEGHVQILRAKVDAGVEKIVALFAGLY